MWLAIDNNTTNNNDNNEINNEIVSNIALLLISNKSKSYLNNISLDYLKLQVI